MDPKLTEQTAVVVGEFDVTQYELADTSILTLKNAKGDDDLMAGDAPVTIEVYSPGSPQGQKALNKASRQSQLRLFRTMRGESSSKDADDADREQVEKLVAFTRSISPNWKMNAAMTYANPRLCYIANQVEAHIAKLGNFSKGSTPS